MKGDQTGALRHARAYTVGRRISVTILYGAVEILCMVALAIGGLFFWRFVRITLSLCLPGRVVKA
jgi:hypothetical protein